MPARIHHFQRTGSPRVSRSGCSAASAKATRAATLASGGPWTTTLRPCELGPRSATPAVADGSTVDCASPVDIHSQCRTHADQREFGFEPVSRVWRGASGANYLHATYSLIGCPDLPPSVCVFTRETVSGRPVDRLAIMRLEHVAASLNLAEVRHLGATLGATHVHVFAHAGTALERRRIELDLRAGLVGGLQRHATMF